MPKVELPKFQIVLEVTLRVKRKMTISAQTGLVAAEQAKAQIEANTSAINAILGETISPPEARILSANVVESPTVVQVAKSNG